SPSWARSKATPEINAPAPKPSTMPISVRGQVRTTPSTAPISREAAARPPQAKAASTVRSSVALLVGLDLAHPGVDPAGQVHRVGAAARMQRLQASPGPATGLAVQHHWCVGVEFVVGLIAAELGHRDRHRAVDVVDLPLERLPHVDQDEGALALLAFGQPAPQLLRIDLRGHL